MSLFTSISRFFLIVVFLFTVQIGGTQIEDPLSETNISVLTCRSGDALYSTFGHTAIRISNPKLRLDQVYNYGLFSFDTPNFYVKFMRGQLPYVLGRTSMKYFLEEYHTDRRSVIEQKLNLTSAQKKKAIAFLENNIKPENRQYAYDFFYDNCGTRVVDVYEMLGDSVIYTLPLESKTFRDLLKENLKSLPWSEFGIDLVIGAQADKTTTRREQMFLPSYIMENIAHAQMVVSDSTFPLAEQKYQVLDFESEDNARQESSIPWPLITFSSLFAFLVFINIKEMQVSQIINKTLIILSGVLGMFLLFMWFGTDHAATGDNWNILWLNPLLIALLQKRMRSSTPLKIILWTCLAVAGINCIFQILPQFFHLAFLPWILALAIAIYKMK